MQNANNIRMSRQEKKIFRNHSTFPRMETVDQQADYDGTTESSTRLITSRLALYFIQKVDQQTCLLVYL